MLTSNQEYVMINLILQRREKHLEKLNDESASPSLVRVWERFYNNLLSKYSDSCEVKYYDKTN